MLKKYNKSYNTVYDPADEKATALETAYNNYVKNLTAVYGMQSNEVTSHRAIKVANKFINIGSKRGLKNFRIADVAKWDDKTIEAYEALFDKAREIKLGKGWSFEELNQAVSLGITLGNNEQAFSVLSKTRFGKGFAGVFKVAGKLVPAAIAAVGVFVAAPLLSISIPLLWGLLAIGGLALMPLLTPMLNKFTGNKNTMNVLSGKWADALADKIETSWLSSDRQLSQALKTLKARDGRISMKDLRDMVKEIKGKKSDEDKLKLILLIANPTVKNIADANVVISAIEAIEEAGHEIGDRIDIRKADAKDMKGEIRKALRFGDFEKEGLIKELTEKKESTEKKEGETSKYETEFKAMGLGKEEAGNILENIRILKEYLEQEGVEADVVELFMRNMNFAELAIGGFAERFKKKIEMEGKNIKDILKGIEEGITKDAAKEAIEEKEAEIKNYKKEQADKGIKTAKKALEDAKKNSKKAQAADKRINKLLKKIKELGKEDIRNEAEIIKAAAAEIRSEVEKEIKSEAEAEVKKAKISGEKGLDGVDEEDKIRQEAEKRIKEKKGLGSNEKFENLYEERIKAKAKEITDQRDKEKKKRTLLEQKLNEELSKTEEAFNIPKKAGVKGEAIIDRANSVKSLLEDIIIDKKIMAEAELTKALKKDLKALQKELESLKGDIETNANDKVRGIIDNIMADIDTGIKGLIYDNIDLENEDVQEVLNSEKVNIEEIKKNNKKIEEWLENSEIIKNIKRDEIKRILINLLKRKLNLTLKEISDTEKISSIIEGNIDEYIKKTLQDMSLDEYLRGELIEEIYKEAGLDIERIEVNAKKLYEVKGLTKAQAGSLPLKILNSGDEVINGLILLIELGIVKGTQISQLGKYDSVEAIEKAIIGRLGTLKNEQVKKAAQYLYEGEASDSEEMKIKSVLDRYAQWVEAEKGEEERAAYENAYETYKQRVIFEQWKLEEIIKQSETVSKAIKLITETMTEEEVFKLAKEIGGIEALLQYIKVNVSVNSLTKAGMGIDAKFLVELGYGEKEIKIILKNYKDLITKDIKSLNGKTLADLSLTKEEEKLLAQKKKEQGAAKKEQMGMKRIGEEAQEKYKNVKDEKEKEDKIKEYINGLEKEYAGSESEAVKKMEELKGKGMTSEFINSLTLRELLGKDWNVIKAIVDIFAGLKQKEAVKSVSELENYVKSKATTAIFEKGEIDNKKLSSLGFSKEEIKNINKNYEQAKRDGKTQELLLSGLAKAKEKVTKKQVMIYAGQLEAKYRKEKALMYSDIADLMSEQYRLPVLKKLFAREGAAERVEKNYKRVLEASDETFAKGLSLHVLSDAAFVDKLIEAIKEESNKPYQQEGINKEINTIYRNDEIAGTAAKIEKIKEYAGKKAEEPAAKAKKTVKKPEVSSAKKKVSIARQILNGDVRLAGRVAAAINRLVKSEKGVTKEEVKGLLSNCAIMTLDELEKLPTIKDLANAVAKVFAVKETDRGAIGHLRVIKGSELNLNNVIKLTDMTQDTFAYRLAAGEDAGYAMRVSDFIDKSKYIPVAVKDAEKVKDVLKDGQAALYTDKEGKTILLVSSDKALELTKAGAAEPIMPAASKENIYDVFGNAVIDGSLTGAAEQLGREIIDAVTAPAELSRQLAYALIVYPNASAMYERMGVKEGADAKEIVSGYYAAANEVIKAGAQGELSAEEVNIEIKLLSAVRDILITVSQAANQGEILGILNKEDIALDEFSKLAQTVKVSKAVNHNTIVEMMTAVKTEHIQRDEEAFVITIEELKKAVETKKGTAEKAAEFFRGNKNAEDILPTLAGRELKKNVRGSIITPMMAKAVSAAA
jgi:hypothetical protein